MKGTMTSSATNPMSEDKKIAHYDVIVLGAGASGLMCAAFAGQRGRRVLVLDSSNKVGKKILMSGGGRCNFTNLYVTAKNFLSENPHFCISALKRYTQWDFLALVDAYKIPREERKHGQLFCLNSAKDILQMLLSECQKVAVEIRTHCDVNSVKTSEVKTNPVNAATQGFAVSSNLGDFTCESLVIATGALSIPSMGATGFGYDIARQFGHTVVPTRAGLVPFTFSDSVVNDSGVNTGFKAAAERLSGLAVDVDLTANDTTFKEAILFTHRGLSGPAALQISNYWREGEFIEIDLFPAQPLDEFAAWVLGLKKTLPKSLLRTPLGEHLPKSLVAELQAALWQDYAETPLAQIPDAALQDVARSLKAWRQKPSGTEGYRTAEVTLGGVDTQDISSKTMESKKQAGLFFIGEVLDVTGHLGGFNFQWAWASGVAAGRVV